jgi:phage/plasmid primase-like uncharacterized protein
MTRTTENRPDVVSERLIDFIWEFLQMKFGSNDARCQGRTLDEAAQKACDELGLVWGPVPRNGKQRLAAEGDKRGKKSGGIYFFPDGQGGAVKNFRTGEECYFFVTDDSTGQTESQRRKMRKQWREREALAEREREATYAATAVKAQRLWDCSQIATTHPYLTRKDIQPHGARTLKKLLIVPVMGATGDITSLQIFSEDGERRFLRDGRVAGGFYVLGDAQSAPVFLVAEGFATAASLHEATELPVVVAFSAGNLASVTEIWRQKRPDARIIIAADDDWKTEKPVKNPGVTKAKLAADSFAAAIAIPDFTAASERRNSDTDFNDLARLLGQAAVRRQIEAVTIEIIASKLRVAGAYEATESGLFCTMETRDGGAKRVRLANFCAWIVAERIEDDGVEKRISLDIEAKIHGRTAHFSIPASGFSPLGWPVEHIGADAVIEPGIGARDRARAGFQYLSGRVPRHHIYSHTGWRKLDGHGWCFLHTDGALGASGPVSAANVNMPPALSGYSLPAPGTPEQVAKAVRAALALLDIAPDRVTVPILGAVYRSVIGGADFSLHLSGFTGSGKSELAALAQQHFGLKMHAKRLPGAWSSTANQLEGLAFLAKDAVFVVDDFVPQGTTMDRARLNQTADRVLRGVGNASGRGRAGPDGKPRPAKPPRALVISTGEEIPGGQSLRARLLVIEVAKNDIGKGDLRTLTPHQTAAEEGLYAGATAAFIQWLAPRLDEIRSQFCADAKIVRSNLVSETGHARTADIEAQLTASWRILARFAVECGALNDSEAAALLARVSSALAAISNAQAEIQGACDPISRFVALLNAVIASGRGHIASRENKIPANASAMGWRNLEPQGRCVGWEDGEGNLYLEPEASFAAVQEMGAASGEGVGIGSATLRKRLHERGMLVSTEIDKNKTRLTVRRTIAGRVRNVIHTKNVLSGETFAHFAHSGNGENEKCATDNQSQDDEKQREKNHFAHFAHFAHENNPGGAGVKEPEENCFTDSTGAATEKPTATTKTSKMKIPREDIVEELF